MSRNGMLITILGALFLLTMVGGYFLLLGDDVHEPVVRPGIAGQGAEGDGYDELTYGRDDETGNPKTSPNRRGGVADDRGTGPDGTKPGEGPDDGESPAGNDGADDVAVPDFDPAEINEPIPGHLLIRVIDKEDDRPLPGTMVYFPIRGTTLEAQGGTVSVGQRLEALTKRTNKHGVAIWSEKELRKLIEHQQEVEDKSTSVLVTAIGFADLFEPLKIPDLKKGAEKTFGLFSAVRVTGKVREKRGGAVKYASVEILQTTSQGDSAKPTNRFRIKADALGEFALNLAESYVYTFHVKQPGYAEYTSREFNFREDKREVSILLEFARGISGVVKGPGGKPVEGAEVRAKEDGDLALTDEDGRFAFDMVKDRIFRNDVNLRVTAEGFAPQSKKVLANDHNVTINLKPEGTLHGIVKNEKGEAIADAVVSCTYMEGRARYPYDATMSDADGKFTFGGFAKGRVMLSAAYEGLHSETTTSPVQAQKNTGPVTLVLTTAASITGTVTSGGVGIQGVTVALNGKATTSTDATGAFTMGGLKPGKHRVKIHNEHPIADEQIRQLPVFTTDGESFFYLPAQKEVELKLGEVATVNFDVEDFEARVDRKITVDVVTRPNEPATGVQVTIQPVLGSPPPGIEAPKTQKLALDLPEGEAQLSLSLLNGVSYEATFVHNRFFTAKLTRESLAGVQDGGTIEVVLERAFIIKGYVTDSEGNGIESVGLSKDRNNPWQMEVSTDIYGYFEFGQLKAGDYLISAFKTSYYQEQIEVEIENEDPPQMDITLVGANEIRIVVTNDGTPQPGANVHIYRNDAEGDDPDDYKRHFDIGTTDARGEKYINFHWVRNYQIVAFHNNKVAFVNFNNLREEPEREFTIALEPSYQLTGVVIDQDTQQPLSGVFVRAHIASTGVDGRDGNFFQLQTNSRGEFDFQVPAGDYYFYVPQTRTHQSLSTEGNTVPAGMTDLALEVLLRDDIEGNYAQIITFVAPAQMTAGQEYTVDVTVKNMGSTTWVSAGNKPWRLGSQGPRDNKTWGMSRVPIPQGEQVRPRDTYTFSFTVNAPAEPGNHDMQWQMVQDGKEWFGQMSEKLTITVVPAG